MALATDVQPRAEKGEIVLEKDECPIDWIMNNVEVDVFTSSGDRYTPSVTHIDLVEDKFQLLLWNSEIPIVLSRQFSIEVDGKVIELHAFASDIKNDRRGWLVTYEVEMCF